MLTASKLPEARTDTTGLTLNSGCHDDFPRLLRFLAPVFSSLSGIFGILQTSAQGVPSAPLTQTQLFAQMAPDMAQVVQLYDQIKGTPIIYLSAPDARQQFSLEDAAKISTQHEYSGAADGSGQCSRRSDGARQRRNQIPIRIYTPAGTGPFPVVVYFHGGGFVVATIDTYDASARVLAALTPAIVVSVEYRKAPEAPSRRLTTMPFLLTSGYSVTSPTTTE